MMIKLKFGGWNFFAAPASTAGSASIFWCKEVDSSAVSARISAENYEFSSAIDIKNLLCQKAIFVKNDYHYVILSKDKISISLICMGQSVLEGFSHFEFILLDFEGLEQKYHTISHFKSLLERGKIRKEYAHPTDQFDKLLNCLIALDGWLKGEFHRETAYKIYGKKRVDEEWPKGYLLSRICRLKKKARELMRGGYLKLL